MKLNRQAMIFYYEGLLKNQMIPKELREHYENLISLFKNEDLISEASQLPIWSDDYIRLLGFRCLKHNWSYDIDDFCDDCKKQIK